MSKMKTEKNDLGNTRNVEASVVVDPALRYAMLDTQNDDEISLIDLWLVLVKRRSLFLSLVLFALLAGISMVLVLPKAFNYSTAIEIGGISHNNNGSLIYVEDPSSVLAKINQSYIPYVTKTYLEKNPEFEEAPEIKAKLEKNSNIIYMNVKGPEKNKNTYIQLLSSIVDAVKQDHKRLSFLKVKSLQLSKKQVESEIIRLKNQEQLFLSQGERLDKKETLLTKRINEARKQLKVSEKMPSLTLKLQKMHWHLC